MAWGVNGTSPATSGALAPRPNWVKAIARSTTRTCCTPPCNSASTAFASCAFNRNGKGGRGMPKYRADPVRLAMSIKNLIRRPET
jgi:hypothetical protein